MSEAIKIDGLEVALEKLAIKPGDMVVVSGDDITVDQLWEFRKHLAKSLPLDVKVPGIIALHSDQRIEAVKITDGDVLLLHGAVGEQQLAAFREAMLKKFPGVNVQCLPAGCEVEVKRLDDGIIDAGGSKS